MLGKFIVAIMLVTVLAQNAPIKNLPLSETNKLTLPAGVAQTFSVSLPETLAPGTSLFLMVQNQKTDLIEAPQAKLSGSKFNSTCFSETREERLCIVADDLLVAKETMKLSITCLSECEILVTINLHEVYPIDFNRGYQIIGDDAADDGLMFQLTVPNEDNFTDIFIEAEATNIDRIQGKFRFQVSVPSDDPKKPFVWNSQALWFNGEGVVLSYDNVQPGQKLNITLFIPQSLIVLFTTTIRYNKTQEVQLNQKIKDYIAEDQERFYHLNLTGVILDEQVVSIYFSFYSGAASITVSFTEDFTEIFVSEANPLDLNIRISAQDRKRSLNFTNQIYISIESFTGCNYMINSKLIAKQFTFLENGVTEVVDLSKSELETYFFSDLAILNKTLDGSEIHKYKLSLSITGGQGQLSIGKCNIFYEKNFKACIGTKEMIQGQNNATFELIPFTAEKFNSQYQVSFEFNMTQCQAKNNKGNDRDYYFCAFTVLIVGQSNEPLSYELTMVSPQRLYLLKEASRENHQIKTNEEQYFVFELADLKNVLGVDIYFDTLEGDIIVIGSNNGKQPGQDIFDQDTMIVADDGLLSFDAANLTKKIYASVYAFERSIYAVSVHVRRGNNSANATVKSISLPLNQQHEHVFGDGVKQMTFVVDATAGKKYIVQVLSDDNLTITAVLKSKNTSVCSAVRLGKALRCTFTVTNSTSVLATVIAGPQANSVFKISFQEPQDCTRMSLIDSNSVELAPNSSGCSILFVYYQMDMDLSISQTDLALLINPIDMNVTINVNVSFVISSRLTHISTAMLQKACGKTVPCPIQADYKSSVNQPLSYDFVIRSSKSSLYLYQGVPEHINTNLITGTIPQRLVYRFASPKSIRVYITFLTRSDVYVAAKIVSLKLFLNATEEKYFPGNQTEASSALVSVPIRENKVSVLEIQSKLIPAECKNSECVLLISVYSYTAETQVIAMDLMVSQTQQYLALGTDMFGSLSQGESQTYTFTANTATESVFSLIETVPGQHKCTVLSMTINGKDTQMTNSSSFLLIPAGSDKYHITASTVEKLCIFTVKYQSLKQPVTSVSIDQDVVIKLVNEQVRFLLYYHPNTDCFKVGELAETGDTNVYATPLNSSMTLVKAMATSLDNFLFKQASRFQDLFVNNSVAGFCSNCFYLIAVKGAPSVFEKLRISQSKVTYLSDLGYSKAILTNKSPSEMFNYFSSRTFQLIVTIFYGDFNLVVKREKQQVINMLINQTQTISVVVSEEWIDFYHFSLSFQIEAQRLNKDCGFSIRARSTLTNLTLVEKLPQVIVIKNEPTKLEFESVRANGSLTLMITSLEHESVFDSNPLQINVTFRANQIQTEVKNVIVTRTGSTCSLNLKAALGIFSITLGAANKVSVSVMLIGDSITYLLPSMPMVFDTDRYFQIYNNPGNKILIEMFNCHGQVELKASSFIEALTSTDDSREFSNTISLQHANLGGHYVVTAADFFNQYFLNVASKSQNDSLLYIITYYEYAGNDSVPYRAFKDSDTQITYTLSENQFSFEFQAIKLAQNKLSRFGSVVYTLYASPNQNELSHRSRCSIGSTYSKEVTYLLTEASSANIKMQIDFDTFGTGIFTDSGTFFVTVVAKVQVKRSSPKQIANLTYFYDITEMIRPGGLSGSVPPPPNSWTPLLLQIGLILAVIVSAGLIIYNLKKCIRLIYSPYPTMCIDEEVSDQTDTTLQSSNKKLSSSQKDIE